MDLIVGAGGGKGNGSGFVLNGQVISPPVNITGYQVPSLQLGFGGGKSGGSATVLP
jgi:hypothetical protein